MPAESGAVREGWKLPRPAVDAIAGAVAGAGARIATAPLDVIKIRFQVQLEPTGRPRIPGGAISKYTGVSQAARDIIREEGIWGLWKGTTPALLLVMPYTAVQFTVLQQFKAFVARGSAGGGNPAHLSPATSFLSGALAGSAATVASYPFDLLRTILASQGEPRVYRTMAAACAGVVAERGLRGLYYGLGPTLVEIVPYAGLQFGFYDTFKLWTAKYSATRRRAGGGHAGASFDRLTSAEEFWCGLGAGTLAKTICHPLDVVKKRFQVVGLRRDPKYGARVEAKAYLNMWDAVGKIRGREGWRGLYKGLLPSVLKAAPMSAITFVLYERVARWLHATER